MSFEEVFRDVTMPDEGNLGDVLELIPIVLKKCFTGLPQSIPELRSLCDRTTSPQLHNLYTRLSDLYDFFRCPLPSEPETDSKLSISVMCFKT